MDGGVLLLPDGDGASALGDEQEGVLAHGELHGDIKTRILNEGKKDLTQSLCILDEYIDTQEGARAIMFLSADNEVGKYAKVRYEVAAKNAKTVAERAFDADKAAKLDSLQSQLLPYMQAAVIGNKMLERAEQQVSHDMSERAGTIYFQDTSVLVYDFGKVFSALYDILLLHRFKVLYHFIVNHIV